jgi:protein-S-isoprenylcysteine O-methyltransferase Ste14
MQEETVVGIETLNSVPAGSIIRLPAERPGRGPEATESGEAQIDNTAWERLGGALFRARSVTPVVLIAIVVLWPTSPGMTVTRAAVAMALVVLGELYRLRAVGVAGKSTRTRGSKVKELVTSGPFARVRNPLYIGNFVLTYGLVVLSKVDWLLWAFPLAFFFQYAAIVAWEESVLRRTFGAEYEHYRGEVRAWIPSLRRYSRPSGHSFRREIALRSERDSLRAIAVLGALLVLKHLLLRDVVSWLLDR